MKKKNQKQNKKLKTNIPAIQLLLLKDKKFVKQQY